MSTNTARRLLAGFFVSAGLLASPLTLAAPLASVDTACRSIASKVRGLSAKECMASGLQAATTASVQGQPILFRDYLAGSRRGTPKRILLIGGIHGDELSSVQVSFEWMRRLAAEKFQPFHWRVAPCLNPDGLLKPASSRTNARGVDLNRNFPTPRWAELAPRYWEQKTRRDRRRWPGPAAASEPETQWLVQQIQSFKPDAIVSVHAPYGILDFDGPRAPPRKLGFLNLNELGTYPGSLGNYAGVQLGLPVITLELPHSQETPTASQSARIWSDLLTWLERNLPKGEPPLYQRLADQNWVHDAP